MKDVIVAVNTTTTRNAFPGKSICTKRVSFYGKSEWFVCNKNKNCAVCVEQKLVEQKRAIPTEDTHFSMTQRRTSALESEMKIQTNFI